METFNIIPWILPCLIGVIILSGIVHEWRVKKILDQLKLDDPKERSNERSKYINPIQDISKLNISWIATAGALLCIFAMSFIFALGSVSIGLIILIVSFIACVFAIRWLFGESLPLLRKLLPAHEHPLLKKYYGECGIPIRGYYKMLLKVSCAFAGLSLLFTSWSYLVSYYGNWLFSSYLHLGMGEFLHVVALVFLIVCIFILVSPMLLSGPESTGRGEVLLPLIKISRIIVEKIKETIRKTQKGKGGREI